MPYLLYPFICGWTLKLLLYFGSYKKGHYQHWGGLAWWPMQETWVQSLGREDLLEKEMATHSSILA